jgi:hypothetical protein
MQQLTAVRLYNSPIVRPIQPALRWVKRSAVGQRVARSLWFPPNWRSTLQACRILAIDYAHLKTVALRRPVDAEGNAIPWYTFPAIEFLRQLDFSEASVFEYGSGNSTVFWGSVARDVVSVEDEESWHAEMLRAVPANCRMLLEPDLDRFVAAIDEYDAFDVVIVDGPARGRTRLKCARAALRHLKSGGMVIVDNADWLPETTAFLRDSELLQVDLTGFSPINSFTGTTSFFFDRTWRMTPKRKRRPMPGVGARADDWEPAAPLSGRVVRCGNEGIGGVEFEQVITFDLGKERRTFRIVGYNAAERNSAIAILDDNQHRILLANHGRLTGSWSEAGNLLEAEIARIRAMTHGQFTEFINAHPFRRYKL